MAYTAYVRAGATPEKQSLSEAKGAVGPDVGVQKAQQLRRAAASCAGSQQQDLQFGGPVGAGAIILISHALLYYFWMCLESNRGDLVLPEAGEALVPFVRRCLVYIMTNAAPTWQATIWYTAFLTISVLCSAFMPGITVPGLPFADGTRLQYNCNGLLSWYLVLALSVPCVIARPSFMPAIPDMLGPLLTVSAFAGNAAALTTWAVAHIKGVANRATGNFVYDVFMGVYLNPRLLGGRLDLKMWSETRISWYFLYLITMSCAVEQFRRTGRITGPMATMLLAHFLYGNACAKGEECIPTTWDIFYENWGWMLSFWNLCGVPLMYSWQSVYILVNDREEHPVVTAALLVTLLAAYYVWDTSNSQKNRFRMALQGVPVARPHAFPQLPWGTLYNAEAIKTEAGSQLLVDGWWRYARKPHYTSDIVMAFVWGATCGFRSLLPWVYFTFFCAVLLHRHERDMQRCKKKYGKDWDRYCATVPYAFVPGLF